MLQYDGKVALVVGGASGIGAATAQLVKGLGAKTIVMDRVEPPFATDDAVVVDLSDRVTIDRALDGLTAVDALFGTAGVADGTPGLIKINFLSHRHIVERLAADGRITPGGAVCLVSSAAGRSWEKQLPMLREFLATSDFDAGERWIAAHDGTDTYRFSKEAMNCYVATTTQRFLPQGVRINAISPGPTDTPLARAHADAWLGYASDYREAVGATVLTPEQMAYPMAFLNSPAASGISGTNLFVDHGYATAVSAGAWPPA